MTKPQETLISFQQLKDICKKEKKLIYRTTLGLFALAALYASIKPVEYMAEGTFRDKAKSVNATPSFAGLLVGSSGNENNAIALMKSRTVAEEVTKNLNLQAELRYGSERFLFLKKIYRNSVAEINHFFYPHFLGLKDPGFPLEVTKSYYEGEEPHTLTFSFVNEETFVIQKEKDGEDPITGQLGQPVTHKNYTFTIQKSGSEKLLHQTFTLKFWPLPMAAKQFLNNLTIEQDRQDKNLLNIKFKHPSRHLAATAVNTLMSTYKHFLRKEQDLIISHQLKYLERRQDEMGQKLKNSMEDHILNISDDIKNIGFPNTTLAIDFLTESQNGLQRKLLDIEFELKRLYSAKEAGFHYYDTYALPGDSLLASHLLTEMRELKQQSDSLTVGLQSNKPLSEEQLQNILTEKLTVLKTNRDYRQEAELILTSLNQSPLIADSFDSFKIASDPRYLVKAWLLKINETESGSLKDTLFCTSEFCSYLKHLIHHFDVQESVIQERMMHDQSLEHDLQGIDLKTSQALFVSYIHKLNEIESQHLQNDFILDEIEKPDFDVSSLNTILTDKVSQDMSTKATYLSLNLKDSNNRSLKEQERIKEDLDLQKRFLSMHLKTTNRLLQLNEELMKHKIKTLQSVTLGLIQQQISLLENNISEYVQSRINNLKAESETIEQHKLSLLNQMSTLPSKWVSEKLLHLQMDLNQKMVEEVSRLVETKNIGNNLEMIQSTIIDPAIAPIHPKPARILFFAILGALIGLFSSLTFVITKSLGRSGKNPQA